MSGYYDGDASISRADAQARRFRVFIEAPNVTAEVYISRSRAQEIHEELDWVFSDTQGAATAATPKDSS